MSKRVGPEGTVQPHPVLTDAATRLFDTLVQGADVWEFGSGGSTLWLAERANSVISIEDDPRWYAGVVESLDAMGLEADVRQAKTSALPNAITDEGMFDVVFVDCWTQDERRRSVILGAQHVKPGGWLVADDYDFPLTHKAVEGLRGAGWDIAVVSGVKMHPIRHVPVETSTAFCHKPEDDGGR